MVKLYPSYHWGCKHLHLKSADSFQMCFQMQTTIYLVFFKLIPFFHIGVQQCNVKSLLPPWKYGNQRIIHKTKENFIKVIASRFQP